MKRSFAIAVVALVASCDQGPAVTTPLTVQGDSLQPASAIFGSGTRTNPGTGQSAVFTSILVTPLADACSQIPSRGAPPPALSQTTLVFSIDDIAAGDFLIRQQLAKGAASLRMTVYDAGQLQATNFAGDGSLTVTMASSNEIRLRYSAQFAPNPPGPLMDPQTGTVDATLCQAYSDFLAQ